MKQFIINEDLAASIVNYLAQKPFGEVAGLINGMQQLRPVPSEPKPVPTPVDESGESAGFGIA